MSCGKGSALGTVGQLRQALLMQVDLRHQSRCSAHNARAGHCCSEVSCASGSRLLCNDLLRDSPSLLICCHRAPQQSQQHPSPSSDGQRCRIEEGTCFMCSDANSRDFYHMFYQNCNFYFFFLVLSVRMKRFRLI